jgi:hypothetical protein
MHKIITKTNKMQIHTTFFIVYILQFKKDSFVKNNIENWQKIYWEWANKNGYEACLFSSVVEHFTCNEKVLGSIPKGGFVFLYLYKYENKKNKII